VVKLSFLGTCDLLCKVLGFGPGLEHTGIDCSSHFRYWNAEKRC
jgi:hypothetical protein